MASTFPSDDHAAPIVIVGAGQAGGMAARCLREVGYRGAVIMVGDEAHLPYERPPLSKAVLADEQVPDVSLMPASFYAEHGIDLKTGTRAIRLDADRRQVELEDGAILSFSSCLLATGGRARQLPLCAGAAAAVHTLRTLDDALRLREAMRTANSVLIIGGGFLGLEIASTARMRGLEAMLVEQGPQLLERALPPLLSRWLGERAAAHGVQLHLNASLASLSEDAGGVRAVLGDGATLRADLAVVAVGLTPEVTLAREAGLRIDAHNGGIVVDAHCRTSAASVFAAGDCTSRPHAATGALVRLESWQNANEQARIAAAAMLGIDTAPAATPWFWTDQFGCNVQMLGHRDPALDYYVRGTLPSGCESGKALLFGVREGRLEHVVAINAGGDLRAFRDAVDQPLACAPQALCDPDAPAKQLARLALGRART